jgi:LuxR family transcriptional regulator, activator of conjugal transfer of Ti plasmids
LSQHTKNTLMHRVFQTYVDRLAEGADIDALGAAIADATAAFDLNRFAYLSLPRRPAAEAAIVSNYASAWTAHYQKSHYERLDPVIIRALRSPEPFAWGLSPAKLSLSRQQQALFDEAAQFGIGCGYTVPVHDCRGLCAAVTFAAPSPNARFNRTIETHGCVLALMAMYFHSHVRRRLVQDRFIDGVSLSPRELQCLDWAARGKTAWEIGRILGISRRTAAFHLDNVKEKFGVHSMSQAVARFAAAKHIVD